MPTTDSTKKSRFPIAALILSALALLGCCSDLISRFVISSIPDLLFSFNLTPLYIAKTFVPMFLSVLLFIPGLILHRKKGNILCGISMLFAALQCVLSLLPFYGFVYFFSELVIAAFFIISGVYYFTGAKILGKPLKLIFGLLAIVFVFVNSSASVFTATKGIMNALDYLSFFEIINYHALEIVPTVISSVSSALYTVYFAVAIILFTPFKN